MMFLLFDVIGHFFDRDLLHRFPYDVLIRYEVIPLSETVTWLPLLLVILVKLKMLKK